MSRHKYNRQYKYSPSYKNLIKLKNAKRIRDIILQNTPVRAHTIEITKSHFYFLFGSSTEKLKKWKIGMSKETR